MWGRRQRGGTNGFALVMLLQLAAQIHRLPVKPPVTVGLIGLQALIFFASVGDVAVTCLHPAAVLAGDWPRLLQSAFIHADEWHLYYNMSSLLWKGVQLEHALGSVVFAAMTAVLLLLSHGLYVLAAAFLPGTGLMHSCAVGFSAVLFALKVVLNARSPTTSSIWGFQVPTKYAAWLELVLISLISPNASFAGHLCGIVAGYAYLRLLHDPLVRTIHEHGWHLAFGGALAGHEQGGQATTTSSLNAQRQAQLEEDEALARALQEQENVR